MSGIRKKHSKEKKLKVVLAALAGEKPVSQIASEHSVHPAQTKEWKSQALEAMGERFAQRRGRKGAAGKPPVDMMDKPAPRDRSFIKGQRYVLLSRRENLTDDRRKNLERLLQANARLNVAYLLREQFEQLWDYADPDDARAFFDSWREQLRDQDLKPYEKFAVMIDKHWDGIKAYAQPTGGGAL